jgi:hypothetical protein
MKAFIYFWTREDILFAAAVLPAAVAWILLESIFAGIATWAITYAVIIGAYEYIAQKRNWPHAAITEVLKEFIRFYNPR